MSHPAPVIITPDFTPSTPTAPRVVSGDFVAPTSPHTALLNPAGDNNDILLTGDNALTAEIVIEPDSVALTVAETNGDVVVTSGDKGVMDVTADFGSGVETMRFFPDGENAGSPIYRGEGFASLINVGPGVWNLTDRDENGLASSSDGPLFPSDATWTGGVTVTASPATATQVIDSINAASLDITATNAPGSDGSGAIAAVAPVAFAGINSPSAISNDWTPQTPSAPPSIGT